MKTTKRLLALFLAVMLVAMIGVMSVTAATGSFDHSAKVGFTMNCDKPGYTFTVYRVADTEERMLNPYEVRYKSLVNGISASVLAGDNANALKALDAVATADLTTSGAVVVGTYSSDTDGATKALSNLTQGIFYVRATSTPSTVKSVRNSIFALPYYDSTNGWTYGIDAIPLATKVSEEDVTFEKTITNSTISGQTEYTEVGMGDTIKFALKGSTIGSADDTNPANDFKLKAYTFTDTMSAGLTYVPDSLKVKAVKSDGTTSNIGTDCYELTVTGGNGEATQIVVSLREAYLQNKDSHMYKSNVDFIAVTYDAILNEHAVIGYDGNPNEAKLAWTNRDNVSNETAPDDAWVYTYGLMVGKTDGSNVALQGAKFQLYSTQEDADGYTNPIAEGTSNSSGEVFFTYLEGQKSGANDIAGKPVTLKAGNYFVRETEAPSGYSAYTKVIPVSISSAYKNAFTNNTWADETKVQEYTQDGKFTVDGNAAAAYPANYKFFTDHVGYVGARVANDKVFLPQTGGIGSVMFYGAGAVLLLAGIVVVAMNLKKRSKASK